LVDKTKITDDIHYELLDAPLLDISASFIRRQIKEKKSIRYLVPDAVFEEIEKNRYYSI
jgi:nicotinate-nucleotide adenylyltransferase